MIASDAALQPFTGLPVRVDRVAAGSADGGKRKEALLENPKLQFVLRGFKHSMGFRVFVFEGIAADRSRAGFTVRADLALIRRYGIPLQELPLLCRAVLERSHEGQETHAFVYSEEDMRLHADDAAARADAARQRRPPRRPVPERAETAPRDPGLSGFDSLRTTYGKT